MLQLLGDYWGPTTSFYFVAQAIFLSAQFDFYSFKFPI